MSETQEEFNKRNHEAWLEEQKHRHAIHDIESFLKDPEAMIELRSGIPIAKLINNEVELKQLILKFGNWENKKFCNLDVLDYFEDIIESVEDQKYNSLSHEEQLECESIQVQGNLIDSPCKVLNVNRYNKPVFHYDETTCYGVTPEEIVIKKDMQDEIKYPCIVRIYMDDDFDRTGSLTSRHIIIIPLDDVMSGRMVIA